MPKRLRRLPFALSKPLMAISAFAGASILIFSGPQAQVNDDRVPAQQEAETGTQDETLEETAEAPAQRPNIIGDVVTLRTLDKVTAITKDFDVKIGESLSFATLRVDVKHCEVKPPEAIPETFAFLQIFEPPQLRPKERAKLTEAPEPIKLFSGWMLASKPAISALDHPVYDVWVIGCKGGAIE